MPDDTDEYNRRVLHKRLDMLQAEVDRLKAEREEMRMELAMLRWEARQRERSDSGR